MFARNHWHDSLLPTIASTYEVVEGYLESLTSAGELRAAPPVPLMPVDALLISLLASYQSSPLTVVDDACAATWGATTVLSATNGHIRRVAVLRSAARDWLLAIRSYLTDRGQPMAAIVEVDDDLDSSRRLSESRAWPVELGRSCLLTSTAKDPSALSTQVGHWLESNPSAMILVLGIGQTGECSPLATLVQSCSGSPRRLTLLRELAPALAGSRLAIVANDANTTCEEALFRIGRLFVDHFRYLDLIKDAFQSALEQREQNAATSFQRNGRSQHAELDSLAALRLALDERERELQQIRNSTAVRLANRLRRVWRLFVSTPGSAVKQ